MNDDENKTSCIQDHQTSREIKFKYKNKAYKVYAAWILPRAMMFLTSPIRALTDLLQISESKSIA